MKKHSCSHCKHMTHKKEDRLEEKISPGIHKKIQKIEKKKHKKEK